MRLVPALYPVILLPIDSSPWHVFRLFRSSSNSADGMSVLVRVVSTDRNSWSPFFERVYKNENMAPHIIPRGLALHGIRVFNARKSRVADQVTCS